MKKKIIIILIGIVVLIGGFILYKNGSMNTGSKKSYSKVGVMIEASSANLSKRECVYAFVINKKFDIEKCKVRFDYAFTTFKDDEDYDNHNFDIQISSLQTSLNEFNKDEIVKQDGGWVLRKDKYYSSDDYEYEIYYFFDDKYEEYVYFKYYLGYIYDYNEAINRFKELSSCIDVYKVKETQDGNYEFYDFNDKKVNLGNCKFIKEIVAEQFGINVKYPEQIQKYSENYFMYYDENLSCSVSKNVSNTDEENTRLEKNTSFTYNKRKWEVLVDKVNDYIIYRTKMADGTYIEIHVYSFNGLSRGEIKNNIDKINKIVQEEFM